MSREEATKALLNAPAYFETQQEGYRSWGKVEVQQIAVRLDDGYLLADIKNVGKELSPKKIHHITDSTGTFAQIFKQRKKINTILLTQQQYAAQVKDEIPPILDDQAQLLGVTVRIARLETEILKALSGRFATIGSNGLSTCIGSSIEDAYVAAQLLEKTSKVFIEAKAIGGAKPINRIEAWFMQQYYQLKYSKEAGRNK
jgi:ribulose-5-phosphate 4-epimerase/fuculose-1-phosphate aldolase